jgi:hypothetical protein
MKVVYQNKVFGQLFKIKNPQEDLKNLFLLQVAITKNEGLDIFPGTDNTENEKDLQDLQNIMNKV